jgi:thiosulfate/3-mercaptopyruvate sulfurtransferase
VLTRGVPRFRGEVEHGPGGWHIQANQLFTQNLGDGYFKRPEQLREEFEELLEWSRAQWRIHQCGGGVSAAPNLLAMEIAGSGHSRPPGAGATTNYPVAKS